MKNKKWLALLTALTMAATGIFAACDGCGNGNTDDNPDDKIENNGGEQLDDETLENNSTKLADFTNGAADAFFATDGWCNGDVFNVFWSAENVTYSGGAAHLSITDKDAFLTECDYYGGELRTWQKFGYGDYSVSMKPLKKEGTASTFFTYTDEYEDTDEDGVPDPHDEIDIEFLGKDTTKVQFNYFVNGVGGHEYMYDLGFDAAEEYHEYGFRWAEDSIVWFVDGEPVHKVEASATNPLPSAPGRIMMNHWCGTYQASGWMGTYEGAADGESADYKWVDTTATPIGEIPEIPDVEEFEGDWSEYTAVALDFTTDPTKYTLTSNGTSTNVKYTAIGNDYSNIMADVTAAAAETNWVHLKLRSNQTGTTPIVRVDVNGTKPDNTTGCLNTSATMNGKAASTDLEWGGSYFNNLPANVDIDVVISFSGVAKSLQIYFDSTRYNDPETYAGDVTVSDIKFAKSGELQLPGTGSGDTPSTPTPTPDGDSVDISSLSWEGNIGSGEPYTLTKNTSDKSINLTYSSLSGGGYQNINADVASIASAKNVFSVKITNNGSAQAKVRIDIDSATKVNETTACNVSATMNGIPADTDTTYGGSMFYVDAGITVTATVTYDASRGPQKVFFYLDSAVYQDAGVYSGNITFSEMAFSGTGSTSGGNSSATGTQLSFTTDNNYTLSPANQATDSLNVTYSGIVGSSYHNINANIASVAAGKNTFSVKIKNNGSATVTLRFDIQGSGGDGDKRNISSSATGAVNYYTLDDHTTYVQVAAGAEAVLTITYDNSGTLATLFVFIDSADWQDNNTYSGNVTLSEFKFN